MTIKPGSVFYLTDQGDDNPQPHYHVVLAVGSSPDELVVLSMATSKVEKRLDFAQRRRLPPETLVILEPGEVPFLPVRTVFDGNAPRAYTRSQLLAALALGLAEHRGEIPVDLLERLKEATWRSPLVSPKIKRIL